MEPIECIFSEVHFEGECGDATNLLIKTARGTSSLWIECNSLHLKFGERYTQMYVWKLMRKSTPAKQLWLENLMVEGVADSNKRQCTRILVFPVWPSQRIIPSRFSNPSTRDLKPTRAFENCIFCCGTTKSCTAHLQTWNKTKIL